MIPENYEIFKFFIKKLPLFVKQILKLQKTNNNNKLTDFIIEKIKISASRPDKKDRLKFFSLLTYYMCKYETFNSLDHLSLVARLAFLFPHRQWLQIFTENAFKYNWTHNEYETLEKAIQIIMTLNDIHT